MNVSNNKFNKSVILSSCEQLENRLHNCTDKSDLLSSCARGKMIKLYKQENEEFDKLLDTLDRSIDYQSYSDVKKCVTKLLKLLQSNRKTLIRTLRRIY